MKVTYELDTNKDTLHDKWLLDHAADMYMALCDILTQTREWEKYDTRGSIPADEIREKIHELVWNHNLTTDELV